MTLEESDAGLSPGVVDLVSLVRCGKKNERGKKQAL